MNFKEQPYALRLADELAASTTAPAEIAWGSQALRDVAAERRRQIEVEGWTPEHDDQHHDASMSIAAACYALHSMRPALAVQTVELSGLWAWTGWSSAWFKPRDRRSNLIRAAALLLAEIERLDRAALARAKEQR